MPKPKRKPIEAATAPPERWQHDILEKDRDGNPIVHEVPTDRAGVQAQMACTQDALDRYHARGEIADCVAENARLFDAGRRLRAAWTHSGLACVVTGGMEPSVDGGRDPDARMVSALDKSREYRRLIGMIPIPCQVSCIVACCWGEPVGAGNSMARLRLGLKRLADGLGI